MLPTYMNFLNKPVDQEFFTKFTAIFSRDESGNAVAVRLMPIQSLESNTQGQVIYCDKIQIGETIDIAIQRTLLEEFGLVLVDYYVPVFALDVVKNKKGDPTTRFPIVAYVSHGSFKKPTLVGCSVSWVDRDTYEYNSCEALQWLKRNENNALFDHEESDVDREKMIDFVKKLYHAGAIDITLSDLNEQFYKYPEPGHIFVPNYLEVRFPKNKESRERIFSLYARGFHQGIQNPIDETDQNETIKYYFFKTIY